MTPHEVASKIGEKVKVPTAKDRNSQCKNDLVRHGWEVSDPIHNLFRESIRPQIIDQLRQGR